MNPDTPANRANRQHKVRRQQMLLLTCAWVILLPLIVFCYRRVDRPVSDWIDAVDAASWPFLMWPHRLVDVVLVVMPLVALLCAYRWWQHQWRPWLSCAIDSCIALSVVLAIKTPLKALFGRTWPDTFYHNNPSYLDHGVYGFAPLSWQVAYWAFPSGHAAQITAVAVVVAWHYTRTSGWMLLLSLAVMADLVLLNYHWVSDVIAGALFGASTALLVTAANLPARLTALRTAVSGHPTTTQQPLND